MRSSSHPGNGNNNNQQQQQHYILFLFSFIIFGQDSSNPFCFADQPLFGISSLSGYRPSHSLCSPKMENDTVGYFDSFFDGEGLAHLLDPQGDIYIITMLFQEGMKSVPRACPAPTMEDWKAFYANELEVIQKFENDKKKIVDALQAAMGKSFTDLFRVTECEDGNPLRSDRESLTMSDLGRMQGVSRGQLFLPDF